MIIKTNNNILTAYGTIWSGDGQYFEYMFKPLQDEYEKISIHLHTGGGSVFDGNLIYNILNKSTAEIELVVDGIAASMGGIIMLSIPKENVKMVENGFAMIHAPSSGEYGNAKDMESTGKLLRLVEKNFIEKFTDRTGKTKTEVEKWMDGADYWFSAEECLEMGLIGEIIPAKVTTPLPVDDPKSMDAKKVYNLYASLFTVDIKNNKQLKIEKSQMKTPLINALSLSGVTAQSSDTAIIEAVTSKIQALEQERDNALNKLTSQQKQQVKIILDNNQGAFDKEKRAVFEEIGEKSGIDALLTVLKIKQDDQNIPVDLMKFIKTEKSDARADWTFEDWQEKDPKGLEKKTIDDPASFNKLFNEQYNKD